MQKTAPLIKSLACAICYASANIKALETLGYAEHICNYVVILDSWFYGKISVVGTPSNLGLIEHITNLKEVRILSIYQKIEERNPYRNILYLPYFSVWGNWSNK
jgi:hypothetical protein